MTTKYIPPVRPDRKTMPVKDFTTAGAALASAIKNNPALNVALSK